ncbi:MAG: DUF3137 domain-containing protein [Salinivirgaceae bacterium]
MESIEKLKTIYNNELKGQLSDMEKLRKTIKRNWLGASALILITFIGYQAVDSEVSVLIIALVGIIAIIFLFVRGIKKYFDYRKQFKKEVVSRIINLINTDFQYFPDSYTSEGFFLQSRLFNQKPDRYRGDDLVTGKIEKTDFEFSEIKAEYKTETTKDGKRQTEWHVIFNGLFFHADFNKHLQGTTFVLPDTAEKLLGKFGQKLQKMSSRGELVKLENPEFEKAFVVYSSSQNEARYILTPVMMEALVDMKKRYKRKMHFSFIGERVYCAVSYNKGLFEPRILKSGVNFDDVTEMYHMFGLIETIINQMNLNTRIWTKE